jgi:enoyl-CoA hydratase/carnithine racemase
MYMGSAAVVSKKDGGVGWVVFNRPETKNAFNLAMWESVPRVIAELADESVVRVIFLRGVGGHFGAGADIKELLRYAQDSALAKSYAEKVRHCFSVMAETEKPLVALVEGYALGGGAMVATACDLRVVAKGASVGIPLPKLGLVVEPIGIKRLMDTVGLAWASKFLLTGDIIPEKELIGSGWASLMAEPSQIETVARSLADRIMRNSPVAIQMTKRVIQQWLTPSIHRDPAVLENAFSTCMAGEDFKEGATAFIEKRSPDFST